MRHERNVLCDMHCNMMQVMETRQRTGRDEHKFLGARQVIERGPWCTAIVCSFSIVLMGAVLLVWSIMTKANRRFRLQLLCLFPCWVGTEQIFP